MVSTGWRTASTVIIIVVGAALLTFAIFIYRRQKQLREGPIGPEMQQRYKGSFAGDPEAHTPLLMVGGELPPIPPKSAPFAHQRNLSVESFTYQRNGPSVGDLREVGGRVRAPRPRVPVPPMFPEPSVPAIQERRSLHGEPKAAPPFPVPEPASPSKPLLFPFANIQFPRIQIKSDGKKGRLPSLRIEFQRESNQVISSPGSAYRPPPSAKHTPPPSTVSAPSTYSRPFATMASSPLPEIPRISPIAIDRRSPTASAPNSAANSVINIAREDASSPSTSVQDVGHGLFTRKLSTEAGSFQTMSRNSSARPASDPGRLLKQARGCRTLWRAIHHGAASCRWEMSVRGRERGRVSRQSRRRGSCALPKDTGQCRRWRRPGRSLLRLSQLHYQISRLHTTQYLPRRIFPRTSHPIHRV
ncbi:hypothetical protein C8Q74DRAFT_398942 [Fomes fomentarius]|nr:hypothetical protein C8Q74DRAFT_398942 [Fomes fomentarius]